MITIASFWVRGIADALSANRLHADSLLREAGISPSELRNNDSRFPHEHVSKLWELAVRESGNPDIGLSAASATHPNGLDVISYVVMSSPSLHHALGQLARFMSLVNGTRVVHLLEEKEGSRLVFAPWYASPLPRARADYTFAVLMRICRWLVGNDIQPLSAEFAYAQPKSTSAHAALMQGAPLLFDAPRYSILFSAADTALPLPSADPQLSELHERLASERLERLQHQCTPLRVRSEIARQLDEAGHPSLESVAGGLCMSERTLRRRLHEEGTNFQELRDQTRQELARHYLRSTHCPLPRIASLLGFSDQGAFFRACRRWFDLSPTQFRERGV